MISRKDIIELARQAIAPEPYVEVKVPFCETVWLMETKQLEIFAMLLESKILENIAQEISDATL